MVVGLLCSENHEVEEALRGEPDRQREDEAQ